MSRVYNFSAGPAVRYAQGIFQNKKRDWNKIVERAMNADFSWKASAKKYEDMYDELVTE